MSLSNDIEVEAPWYNRLLQPVYRVKDAARYSGVHSAAVARWLRRGDPAWWDRAPGLPLSYLELVEVAFATYFRSMGVPFDMIRNARQDVARHFGSGHPFAEIRFKDDGYRVLLDYPLREIERYSIVDEVEFRRIPARVFSLTDVPETIVPGVADSDPPVMESGVWFDLIEEKSSEFDYEFGLALTWHPVGKNSSVTIDPRMSFGDPSVGGIPTWVIKGRWEAGESLDVLGYDYGLPGKAVEDALRFEGVDFDSGR
jgi:uncharacterized protein (DUF433 family)